MRTVRSCRTRKLDSELNSLNFVLEKMIMFLICVLIGIMVKPIWYGLFRTIFMLPKTIFTIRELKQFLIYPSLGS